MTIDYDELFWSKVDATGSCWFWLGAKNRSGYGSVSRGGKSLLAHRYSYSSLTLEDISGRELDHICRTRSCVNPDHLEPVSRSENMKRAKRCGEFNKSKTHCPAGHAYTEESTYTQLTRGMISRSCLICRRVRNASR